MRAPLLVACLLPSLLASGQEPPADLVRSVVTVVVTRAGDEPRTAAGIVVQGGFVVTTMGCLNGAAAVEVVPANGKPRPALGVADYQNDANIALIAVDWDGAPPSAIDIAESAPAKGAELPIARPDSPRAATAKIGSHKEPFGAAMESRRSSFARVFSTNSKIDPSWGGAPLMDGQRVVGVVTGISQSLFALALPNEPGEPVRAEGPARWFDAARPELIRALKAREPITWDNWARQVELMGRARIQAGKAGTLGQKGKHEEAIENARESVRLDDRCWYGWTVLAYLLAPEDGNEALAAVQRTIDLVPTDIYARGLKASILAQGGEFEEALAVATRTIELDPTDARGHVSLGYVHQYAGEFEKAVAAYETAIKLDPRNEHARRELARVRDFLGVPAGAADPRTRF